MSATAPSLLPSYGRALLGALPGPLGAGGGDSLPEGARSLEGVEVDRGRLAAYDRVCGFALSDRLPPTYPHVLAFPIAMALMTERSFPFPLLGLVHVANRIEQRRPLLAGQPLDLSVRAEDLRPHRRGRQLDVVAEASAGGEVAWVGRSTYLHREKAREDAPEAEPLAEPDVTEPRAVWSVPGDVGRRYADVSGDRNPIHLHPLSARLFGFPRAIAHGMWMKARCLAALDAELPESFAVRVEFRKPLLIPGRAAFAFDGSRFALADHLRGEVS